MNSIATINYTKRKYQCVYFIRFTSTQFEKELFKIGITTNLNERLRSLRQEFKICGEYQLLLAIPVDSDEIEKDLLHAFRHEYPDLKIFLTIYNSIKTECFIYDDKLLESVELVKSQYSSQTSNIYIENITVKPSAASLPVTVPVNNINVEYKHHISFNLINSSTSTATKRPRFPSERRATVSIDGVSAVNEYSDFEVKKYNVANNSKINNNEHIQIITMKSNGYVNVSKLCKSNGKKLSKWLENVTSKSYISFLMNELGLTYDELIIDNQKLKNEYRGKYAHRYITDEVARWVSDDLAFKVARIIDDYVNEETHRILRGKDERIDNLERQIRENTEELRLLRIESSKQTEELRLLRIENGLQTEELRLLRIESSKQTSKLEEHADESKKSFGEIKSLLQSRGPADANESG